MDELTIYKYKAREIEDTLRLVANLHNSRKPTTCFDRKVCKSIEYIQETLGQAEKAGEPFSLQPSEQQLQAEFKEMLENFSDVLLKKLMANERKYGFGDSWKLPDWEADLHNGLQGHVQKGDPRDVAIYALFAWYHNWLTAPTL